MTSPTAEIKVRDVHSEERIDLDEAPSVTPASAAPEPFRTARPVATSSFSTVSDGPPSTSIVTPAGVTFADPTGVRRNRVPLLERLRARPRRLSPRSAPRQQLG
jgi:hypothetical protein